MTDTADGRDIAEFGNAPKAFAAGWAALGATTTLAPLYKLLDPVVPLVTLTYTNAPFGPGLMRFSAEAVRAAGVLASIVIYALTVSQRFELKTISYKAVHRKARNSFALALVVLVGYWMAYPNVPRIVQSRWFNTAGEAGISILYIGFYVLMTRGFVLLSMNDYVNSFRNARKSRQEPNNVS